MVVAGKKASCNTRIPNGLQFESQLLHFQFRSLLMHLGKKQNKAKVLASLHPEKRLGRSFWFQTGLNPGIAAIWVVNQWTEDLSPGTILSLTLPSK